MAVKKLRERLFSWKLMKKTFVIHRTTDGALRFRIDYRDRRKTTLPTYVQWFNCLENTILNYPELAESSEANAKYKEALKYWKEKRSRKVGDLIKKKEDKVNNSGRTDYED